MLINRALGVLLMIVFAGISVLALQQPAEQPQAANPAANPDGVPRITVEELKAKLDNNEKVVVVDVRKHTSSIIKGALHIPLEDFEKRLNELPKDRLIVTVCS